MTGIRDGIRSEVWYLSSYTGYDGDYRYANVGGTPDSAIWTASLPCSGSWKIYAWVRKGSNRTTSAKYKVKGISRDTFFYLNQYSTSSDTGWFYLGEVCTDTFLVTLYDQAPDGSVVIADGIKFQWSSSTCYTNISEDEKRENLDIRFERGRIVVFVPKKAHLRLSVYSADGRRVFDKVFMDAVGLIKQPFEGKGIYFVVAEFEGVKKVKKIVLKP
jgi:hypothetical protein